MKHLDKLWDKGTMGVTTIQQAERLTGFRFPNSYKQLLCSHNQLIPKQDCFKFRNIYGEEDERNIMFFGYGEHSEEKVLDNQSFDVYGHCNIVAIGRAANGDYICFDYRHDPKTTEPHVVVMFHDDYVIDQDGQKKMSISIVAPTFDAFIDMLYSD